jgi:UDP-2-acetamido-2,6-beta-L-arabino-hexul-4-ose reductase
MIKSQVSRRILVTGGNGFIGKNLIAHLNEQENISVFTFLRGDSVRSISKLISESDAIVHLAGENRPSEDGDYVKVNVELTRVLCDAIKREFEATGRHIPIVMTSSIQVEIDNPYGRSKLAAEEILKDLAQKTGNPCVVFRLQGVFGKWCRPNYNSVVATFCHNYSRDLPVKVSDPSTLLRLVYIDDVVTNIFNALKVPTSGYIQAIVSPEYIITLGELKEQIEAFARSRTTLITEDVGVGLVRSLYSTYISYLPKEKFSYLVPQYPDSRGVFVEMLKTSKSGQLSYFTAHPGVTRGGHYHHTKTEKFLVIKGHALFRFKHLVTNEIVEFKVSYSRPEIVDTIPGWIHDITNVGDEEMLVMLWANENFDPENPDTVTRKL